MKTGKEKSTAGSAFRHDFFETTSVTDFVLTGMGRPPRGYPPRETPDVYSPTAFHRDYEKRRRAFLAHCLRNPARKTIKGYYYELARVYKNRGPVHEGALSAALAYIDKRRDCADFVMLGIVRLLCQFPGSRLLTPRLLRRARETVLRFKYWPDEPGTDSMCTWTENHQIMFASNEYLAGQLFPDRVFENSGMTGMEKMERSRRRILRWMDLRYRTGFSEWLSHVYYDEDITALVNLVDFSRDPLVARRAAIILDLIFFDIALNSHRGVFGSTHGRSYAREKKNALAESTTDTSKLLFGTGVFSGADNMSAVCVALSERYRLPRVIFEVASGSGGEMVNRQRMGIRIGEAGRWGIGFDDFESGMELLSLEAYAHPKTIGLVMKMFDEFNWWENNFFSMFKAKKGLITAARKAGLLPLVARLFEKDITRNTREEVNVYTYRTAEYMLSCAQDYRPGYGGDQQHIWQATLSPRAVCFTTHPGGMENGSSGYWVGSGTLPRVAQIKNLLIAGYRISAMPGLYKTNRLFFTHAYFPAAEFDEIAEKGGWVFGRKGGAYIALYSQRPYRWQDRGDDAGSELIAEGKDNFWICEMGRGQARRDFPVFVEKVAGSPLRFKGGRVRFESPSQGTVEFGHSGPLRQDGRVLELDGYPRYDNPYAKAEFPPGALRISAGKHWLALDLQKGVRETSGYI